MRKNETSQSENIRALVLESLLMTDKGGKSSDIGNSVLFKYAYLPKVQRAFYTRLFEGVLERQITLDYILDTYSATKTAKMKPAIRQILRMGVYQIKYMDSVPASAAVNEAVKLAVRKGFSSLKGFVNGVLRNVIRQPEKVKWPEEGDAVRFLSVMYSVPEVLAEGILNEYGFDAAKAFFAAMNEPRPVTVRLRGDTNAVKKSLEAEGVSVTKAPCAENAWYLSGFDSLTELAAFRNGGFAVMDAASILCAESAGIKPGDCVLDLCAAPGGKAFYAADIAGESGRVDARDISEKKAALLRENAERLGIKNSDISVHDAAVFDESLAGKYDVVLCDVPCSGYGVMGRKPDIRYRTESFRQPGLVQLQRRILINAARYVKEGGFLSYSTCTVGRYENDDNIDWFLKEYPDFVLESMRQLLPGRDETDGFFMARLAKRGK
ncbi:MAG: 16S rRNA (cytosine(967)-C(5))-methyltransferase RsmB [Eubacterium sp.]|nr:16S rRNA (cytosine(967)-C(5))-methyltransferase RsmB [Eubacterium sp.]